MVEKLGDGSQLADLFKPRLGLLYVCDQSVIALPEPVMAAFRRRPEVMTGSGEADVDCFWSRIKQE
jgi:hypothetical protein